MIRGMHSIDKSHTSALLLLGGTGTRFGSDLPKQFHRLCGKKVYLHALETLIDSRLFENIVLVCPKEWISEVKKDTASHPTLLIVEGGASRQESSFRGLLALPQHTQTVVIHDAVRPFISRSILSANVTGARQFHAIDTCIPSADTLVHAPNQKIISAIPSRSEFLRGQTPQSFSYPLILKAHQQALADGIHNSSDDCSLVVRLGHPIHVIQGSERNIKITTELDMLIAEQLFRMSENPLAEPSTQLSLSGKTFAITGGMGDIGKAIAHLLEKEGAHAIPISRTSLHYPADLSSFRSTQAAFDQIQRSHGPLDGLINSIGLLQIKELSQLSHEDIDRQIATNLSSVVYACKCVSLKPGSPIVNIASSSYSRGKKNYALYSSAKAAVVNFTQALAEERPDLRVNAAVPQRTCTKMRKENFPDEDPTSLLPPEAVAREILELLKHPTLTGAIVEIRNAHQ